MVAFNDRAGTNPFAAPKALGGTPALEEPRPQQSDVLPLSSKTASSSGRAAAWRLSGRVMPLGESTFGSLFSPQL